jgi:protein-S-isoprenylcysteine O-methyltransferase Ste14
MNIKSLVGAGDKIMLLSLPFAVGGIILNILYPQFFQLHLGLTGIFIGAILLAIGIPFWLFSVVLMMRYVPQNKLITKGPFAVISHPIYTSVAVLVIPGLGFLFDTWVGLAIGAILYIISRIFRGQEDKKLNAIFAEEYQTYRSKVLIPWL